MAATGMDARINTRPPYRLWSYHASSEESDLLNRMPYKRFGATRPRTRGLEMPVIKMAVRRFDTNINMCR